ncbi:MAG: hypothetical protein HQL65_01115 [Magnetococcales bacterium]|nr:hypothetical protein [Magnetococcales bacterium]
MNMQPVCPSDAGCDPGYRSRSWHPAWIILGLFLFLVGCSRSGAPEVDPEIYARDTFLETLQRLFMPKTYWSRRIEQLERAVSEARTVFQQHHAAYRQLLITRRQLAMASGHPTGTNQLRQATGRDPQSDPRPAGPGILQQEARRDPRSDPRPAGPGIPQQEARRDPRSDPRPASPGIPQQETRRDLKTDPGRSTSRKSTHAWVQAIQTTRDDLERLRRESRIAGQDLQQKTLWLKQAEQALNHASW